MNKTTITAEPEKLDLYIAREFDAPREMVFKACTDPVLFAEWIGPSDHAVVMDTFEAKSGGSWRFINKDSQGNEYGFRGVFHDVTAPERVIQTFEFEGLPERGHVILETYKFEALPGNRTRLVSQSVFQSVEDRDGMMEAGMERGVVDGYEKMDAILERLK